jgi:hypothetical protein
MQEVIRLTMGFILTAATGCASTMCPATYDVYYLPQAEINIDGSLDEPDWKKARCERDFSFPWEAKAAPATDFAHFLMMSFFTFPSVSTMRMW